MAALEEFRRPFWQRWLDEMTPTESITLGLALVLLSTVKLSAHSTSRTGAILTMLALLAVALVVLHQWVPKP